MTTRALFHTCALALCVLLAASATAHNAQYPVPAAKALIQKKGAGARFSFRTARDVPFISLTGANAHDPSVDGFKLLVTGSGTDPEHTEIITLDPDKWKRLERRGELTGYRYRDDQGTRGGVRRVVYKEGQIKIRGGGKNWTWLPSDAQQSVRILIQLENEWYCSELGGNVRVNKAGHFRARDADAPLACPSQVCGNNIVEAGEACDDGNLNDEDGCNSLCELSTCEGNNFASTFEAIQTVVFDGYGCSEQICHGNVLNPAGDLSLLADASYDALIDIAADNGQASDPRVKPGEPADSYLYQKLAAATLGSATSGTPMPVGGALSLEHLEAVEKWIRGGAPRDLVVEGTASLLASCLPEPDPLKIRPPEPPIAGTGVQLRQTAWPLPAQSEDEVCVATYFDFSTVIPPSEQIPCSEVAGSDDYFGVNNPSGKCFRYSSQELAQDPQSHHSIIHIYRGQFETDYVDPAPAALPAQFVPWTYKFDEPGNPLEGEPCNPKDLTGYEDLGYHPNCSSRVDPSIACIGWGPPDLNQFGGNNGLPGGDGGNIPSFSGSQEPYYEQQFIDGVYAVLPMQGVVVWNSHAFNLTNGDSTMNQYLNLELADPNEAQWPLRGIFESEWIFAQNTPPFETEEICATWTAPQDAHVFELSSHTHVRGVLWRTWAPPNTPCEPGDAACVPRGDTPIYTSTEYSDPLQLDIDPPLVVSGPQADRTFLFCSVFDNGSAPGSPPVKRQSTSPSTPPVYINGAPVPGLFLPGGPCPNATVACMDGPNKGELCGGNDTFCDSTPGAGDGECDACPGWGGVTTEDEMFILLGSFFVP